MFAIKKVNKKLHIVENDAIVYTVPNFIRSVNRMQLNELVKSFNSLNQRSIDAIIDWESKFNPKNKHKIQNNYWFKNYYSIY